MRAVDQAFISFIAAFRYAHHSPASLKLPRDPGRWVREDEVEKVAARIGLGWEDSFFTPKTTLPIVDDPSCFSPLKAIDLVPAAT